MLSVAKKLDEKGRVYIKYTDFGSKTIIHGGLKDMKVQNKTIRYYENLNDDANHCVANLFVEYFISYQIVMGISIFGL